ncbi:MAG: hypothetical protein QMB14_01495 [Polaromonas sp.]
MLGDVAVGLEVCGTGHRGAMMMGPMSFEFYVDAEGLPQITQISPSPNTGVKK